VSLQVTSEGDCRSSVERTSLIKVYDSPAASFTANPEETILKEATISFTNNSTSTETLSYEWDFQDGQTSSDANPVHTYQATGTYDVTLTVITNHHCEDTYSYEITVYPDFAIFVPNAFTPNGDGVNDRFKIISFGVNKYQLQIYSKWGDLIYESNNLEDEWDAADVPGGTYVYVIHATTLLDDPIEKKGTVTVVK
jgi:gliding motility-associated-like protein